MCHLPVMIYLRGTQLQTGDTRALIKVASPDFSATQRQTLRPELTGPALSFFYGTGLARLWVSRYIPSENTSEKNQNVSLHLPSDPLMYESLCSSNTLNMCVCAHACMRACVLCGGGHVCVSMEGGRQPQLSFLRCCTPCFWGRASHWPETHQVG